MVANAQKDMDTLLARLENEKQVPRLLLHACCAPCSSYVLEYLSQYFHITVLFYNPNIEPEAEYRKREQEIERFINEMDFKYPVTLWKADYEPEKYEEAVKGLEKEPEGGSRCAVCFRLRLAMAAQYARVANFDYFTTTLSISPHKNAKLLNEIGAEMEAKYGAKFLPADFKKKNGYLRSIELSKEHDLYRQSFCGCIYSMRNSENSEK